MAKPFESLKARIAPASSPLHINPMISSPTPSIISTEAALTNMVLQHQGQDHQMESMLNSMTNRNMLSNINGGANPNNMHLTSSLMSLLNNSGNTSIVNGLSSALNMQLQQNGQHSQQGLLNAIAQHQQNSHTNGTNYSFVNNN